MPTVSTVGFSVSAAISDRRLDGQHLAALPPFPKRLGPTGPCNRLPKNATHPFDPNMPVGLFQQRTLSGTTIGAKAAVLQHKEGRSAAVNRRDRP